MNDNPRQNNFDLIRLFGALLVVYSHAYAMTGVSSPGFAVNGVGTIGVKIFFAISGYLVAGSWLRDPSAGRFFMRRALRIFPALIGVTLLSVFLMGPVLTRLTLSEYFFHSGTYRYLSNICLYINYLLPGLFEKNVYPNAVNGSLWSLPAEFAMYLLTPILISIASLSNRRIVFAFIAVTFAGVSLWYTAVLSSHGVWVVYATDVWSWLAVAPYFVAGMAYAVCGLKRFLNIYVAFAAFASLAIFQTSAPVKEAALLLILPYASLAFALGYTPVLHRLTRGVDLSYGIFLYGFPIQQVLTLTIGPQIGPWINFLIAAVLSAGFAYVSWHAVEKPALAWKPKPRRTYSPAPGTTIGADLPGYRA
jgi:peptidoglycan/LPS O-acetylase OafA/YrhL